MCSERLRTGKLSVDGSVDDSFALDFGQFLFREPATCNRARLEALLQLGRFRRFLGDHEDFFPCAGFFDPPAGFLHRLARKRFAASNYGEAFRLSDVKTHSLATYAAARRASAPLGEPSAELSPGVSTCS